MKILSKYGESKIIDCILNVIDDGSLMDIEVSELHQKAFNSEDFIIGYHESTKFMEKHYGIFEAISTVVEYEKEMFGEVTTDISTSEKLLNMLVYILGENLIGELESLASYEDGVFDDVILYELKTELLQRQKELDSEEELEANDVILNTITRHFGDKDSIGKEQIENLVVSILTDLKRSRNIK